MGHLWRREDSRYCSGGPTITVTKTVLQGAATSTLINLLDATNTGLIATATGEAPSIEVNAMFLLQTSGGAESSTSDLLSTSTVSSQGPDPTTTSLADHNDSTQGSTVSLTRSVPTTKTLSLTSATTQPQAHPTTTECPISTSRPQSSPTPAGTIAGSIVGSMAGLALIIGIVSYLLRRKRKVKFTFKRKVVQEEKKDAEDVSRESKELEDLAHLHISALETLERRRSFASPLSFDFGLDPRLKTSIPHVPEHSTAAVGVAPARWL